MIFLGGTCNNSTWRETLIKGLNAPYFNPVIEDGEWTDAHQKHELKMREECEYNLYVITPEMTGVYSIAEAVDDSNKRPKKTIFCILRDGFEKFQKKSLETTAKMVATNIAAAGIEEQRVFANLDNLRTFLNDKYKVHVEG